MNYVFNLYRYNHMFVQCPTPLNLRDQCETCTEIGRHRRRGGLVGQERSVPASHEMLIAGHLNSMVLKGMSTTVINVFMPCLLFSKTVPSFTTDNLPEVGVLILTAVFYQRMIFRSQLIIVCGLMIALIVRWLTPLPGWRNGLIFAGVFSNWGNIGHPKSLTKFRRYSIGIRHDARCVATVHASRCGARYCLYLRHSRLVFSHDVSLWRLDACQTRL
jgi:hypothetical protein